VPIRRALTQARRAGAVDTSGAAPLAQQLAHALDVSSAGDDALDLTHGFHTFPARMHPLTARRVLAMLGDLRGRSVLDPFCGSGTVLVEAHRAGARALGIDLSPLAVLVARAKCAVDEPLDDVVGRAREIAERVFAEGRAARRAGGPRGRRLPDEVWRAFEPHVAAEIAALRDGAEEEPEALRAPLLAILSSIVLRNSAASLCLGFSPSMARRRASAVSPSFLRHAACAWSMKSAWRRPRAASSRAALARALLGSSASTRL